MRSPTWVRSTGVTWVCELYPKSRYVWTSDGNAEPVIVRDTSARARHPHQKMVAVLDCLSESAAAVISDWRGTEYRFLKPQFCDSTQHYLRSFYTTNGPILLPLHFAEATQHIALRNVRNIVNTDYIRQSWVYGQRTSLKLSEIRSVHDQKEVEGGGYKQHFIRW